MKHLLTTGLSRYVLILTFALSAINLSARDVSTYWMWLSGHITRHGIEKDLEAMKNAGIGSCVMLNVGLYPDYGNVVFNTQEWWDHVEFAMHKADSLGIEFGIYNGDGWSMSGGPWIDIEHSMKVVTSDTTKVRGGKTLSLKLGKPAHNILYEDIAILAYPSLLNEEKIAYKITDCVNVTNTAALQDNNPKSRQRAIFNYIDKNNYPYIIADFGQSRKIRRVDFDLIGADAFLNSRAIISYSDDGKNFAGIPGEFPLCLKSEGTNKELTFNFPEIQARYLKISVDMEYKGKTPVPSVQDNIRVGEISIYQSPKVLLWEGKSAISKRIKHDKQQIFQRELAASTDEALPGGYYIDSKSVIDLTDKVDAEGNLIWKAPKGDWTILRVGYTSTLRKNSPASAEGRGYECDKMDPEAVKIHFDNYTAVMDDLYVKTTGKHLDILQIESWEAGIQNWTRGFENVFEKMNGYSLKKWLPVMSMGLVVDSYEASDKFLWDLRRTISLKMADSYWGTLHRECEKRGIKSQSEASGMQQFLYDPINYLQYSAIPMGEFWTSEGVVRADCKAAASMAHLKGRQYVSGESFTGSGDKLWQVAPYDFKQIGDEAYCYGVNNFTLHVYVHQPYDIKPGITLQKFGNHFQRLNTWYNYADGWVGYLNRTQNILQQGRLVTDVAYFTGEGIPGYLGLREELYPKLPASYDYDGVNIDFVRQMSVRNGRLTLPNGVSHACLIIRDKKITPELAIEIKRLVEEGATVVADKPVASPSLKDYPACDKTVARIADEVWGKKFTGRNAYGKGRVIWCDDLQEVLDELQVLPDFKYSERGGKVADTPALINYTHRKTADRDIYFVANYLKQDASVSCTFRAEPGRVPQIVNSASNEVFATEYSYKDGLYHINLELKNLESRIVIFSAAGNKIPGEKSVAQKVIRNIAVDGQWEITFTGEPADGMKVMTDRLFDWSKSDNDTLKYYTGAAEYKNSFDLGKRENGQRYFIDLGKVRDIAVVEINGKPAAKLWMAPYSAEITDLVKDGANEIKVTVVNTCINQLAGDERYPNDVKYGREGRMNQPFPDWFKGNAKRDSQRKYFISYKYPVTTGSVQPSGILDHVTVRIME